jgi:hypothetical protein
MAASFQLADSSSAAIGKLKTRRHGQKIATTPPDDYTYNKEIPCNRK